MTVAFSRRAILALIGSASASAALPIIPSAAGQVVQTAKAPDLAWIVGTPGEMDWQHIVARTSEEAQRHWVSETIGGSGCEVVEQIAHAGGLQAFLSEGGEQPNNPCDCEWCMKFAECEANRVPSWDGRPEGSMLNVDWLKADFNTLCCRCDYECSEGEGTGFAVGSEAVCESCMTIADWRIVDPERAVEIDEGFDTPRPSERPVSEGGGCNGTG